VDDLYIAVGNGNVGARDVVHAAYPELRQSPRAPRIVPAFPPRGRAGVRPDTSMPITGLVPGMAYHFAGCCHPVPGDEIVGIVATGKGVTIHARECQTLEGFAATPERFIDVDWNYEVLAKGQQAGKHHPGHTARISVISDNEGPALANLTNAIAKQDGVIANLKIVNRQQDFMEALVDVEVRDVSHLSKVIAGLRGVSGIKGVERAKA
jgi:GTP pyrophosphokinase